MGWIHALAVLALSLAAGCDRTYRLAADAGARPGDASDARDASEARDALVRRDAPFAERDAGLPPDEPRSGRITLVEVEPAPGSVLLALDARFADRPLAGTPPCAVEEEIGACRRLRCATETFRGSAGELLVDVGGAPAIGTMELMPGVHQGSAIGGAPPGASITIRASGADVPAFRIDAQMPGAFAPVLPARRVPGMPVRIDAPPAGTELVIATVSSPMGDPSTSVTCTVPGDGTAITIEGPLLDPFPMGEPLRLTVVAADRHVARASPYAIEAYVGRAAVGELDVTP